jgi:hypothetical protein
MIKQEFGPHCVQPEKLVVGGISLCRNGFIQALDLLYDTYLLQEKKVAYAFRNPNQLPEKPEPRNRLSKKCKEICCWMSKYLEEMADKSPNSDHYYLLMFLTWQKIHNAYYAEKLDSGISPYEISTTPTSKPCQRPSLPFACRRRLALVGARFATLLTTTRGSVLHPKFDGG